MYLTMYLLLCQQLPLDCANIETLDVYNSLLARFTYGLLGDTLNFLVILLRRACVRLCVCVCLWVVCTGPVPFVGAEKSRELRNENRYYWSQWRFVSLRFLCLLRSRRIYTSMLIYKTVKFGGGLRSAAKNRSTRGITSSLTVRVCNVHIYGQPHRPCLTRG